MRNIAWIDLENHYGKEELSFQDVDRSVYYSSDISSLIDSFPKINNPSFFRHRMMQLLQLFFDGILENPPSDRENRKIAKDTAFRLIDLGKNIVSSFYRGEEMDFDLYCTDLLSFEQELLRYSANRPPNPRHLERRLDIIQRVGLSVQEDTFPKNIDSLVVVANGGFEPGLLVADILENNFILPIRFSNYNRSSNPDKQAKFSNLFTYKNIRDHIQSKKVLVIEDLICGGESLMKTMQYVQKRKPSSLVGISATISEYYLQNYPPHEIYIKDAKTHQFTLDSNQGINKIDYDVRFLKD